MFSPVKGREGLSVPSNGLAGGRDDDGLVDVNLKLEEREINPLTGALRKHDIEGFFGHVEKLYAAMVADPSKLIRNRRYHLQTYKTCFKGDEFVNWLVRSGYTSSRVEATAVGCSLLMHGMIHHVCDDHHFKDEGLFYRFRRDDGTWVGHVDERAFQISAVQATRLHGELVSKFPHMIKARDYGITTYQRCFVGSYLVDWLIENGKCASREAAVDMGRRLRAFGFIDHVTEDHDFEDKYLYFRFYVDSLKADKGFLAFSQLQYGLAFLGHIDPPNIELTGSDTVKATISDRDIVASKLGQDFQLKACVTEGTETPGEFFEQKNTDNVYSSPGDLESEMDLSSFPWYHGDLSREDTVDLFQKHGMESGTWLIRNFRRDQSWFVISECFDNNVYHIIIRRANNYFRIDDGPVFESLPLLIAFYQTTSHREVPTALLNCIGKEN